MQEASFEAFMVKVDEIIRSKLEYLDSNDLEDYSYRDCFDSGMTAEETANDAIRQSCPDFFGNEE